MILHYKDSEGNSFEYETDEEELSSAIIKIFSEKYDVEKLNSKTIIENYNLWEELEEEFEEEIKDYFSNKAYEDYFDNKKYPTDSAKYGIKQSWFI